MAQNYKFLVGTYTDKTSDGIYYCSFENNQAKIISHSPKIDNPSFLTLSKNNQRLYSVSETDSGKVVEFEFNSENGNFRKLNEIASGGGAPCYINLADNQTNLYVGNYMGGNVSVFSVENNTFKAQQLIQFSGRGPNKTRQENAHVHSVNFSPDGKYLLVADLGTDIITIFKRDTKNGQLQKLNETHVSSGSGPRHLSFHPKLPIVYIIQELTYKVSAYNFSNGKLTFIEEVSTLPVDAKVSKNSCADLHISGDGRFLYGSNRYFDTIVTYKIEPKTGKLKQIAQTAVKGKTPRNFAITPDGQFMFVANQDSDNIVVFKINKKTGALSETGIEYAISMPVCIKFLN